MAIDTLKSKRASTRVRRNSLTSRNKLGVKNQDPAFVYRIVNDISDRIEVLQQQDWEIDISDTEVDVSIDGVKAASSLGSAKTISVGQGVKAVVMRKKREFHEEDQAFKQEEINKTEQTIKQNAQGSYGGKFSVTRD